MKKLLAIILVMLLVVATLAACVPSSTDTDTSTDVGGNTDTDKPSVDSTDTDKPSDTPSTGEGGGTGDTNTGDGNDPDKPSDTPSKVEITASKTADEMAASIGKGVNGDVVSGKEIKLDSNIFVTFGKGSANTEPALYSGAIRIYQNGGTLTVGAKNGCEIKSVIITFSDGKNGSGKLTVSGGSTPTQSGNTLTITSNSGVGEITVTVSGADKNDRLYVEAIDVIYLGQESSGTVTPENPDSGTDGEYIYNEFTSDEKSTYNEYVGFVIPFLPTDDYYVEGYEEDGYRGVYLSAVCGSRDEFDGYLMAYSSYVSDGEEKDEYGDVWYLFSRGNVYIDICYYEYEGVSYVDVDAYYEASDEGDGGNTGDNEGGNLPEENKNVITNAGASLPKDDGDGIYDIDFTDADKIKDVTDQGYYLDGCPTVGSPSVLVIPVEFSDRLASTYGYDIENIKKAFYKDGKTDYYSVYDYYYISSMGQLTLDITVVDEWFRPSNTSTYYANQMQDGELIGDQMVMNEALAYLSKTMDLSEFDSDENQIIDAVVLVTTLKIDEETDFYWAYRYWNTYTDANDYYYEYDGVSANDYLWASYSFLHEDTELNKDYTNTEIINPYTFIHEFGHILGSEDYYDTGYTGSSPLDGNDIMDAEIGDHNAYTKFNFGWIKSSRLVVTDTEITVTLEEFSKNGDTLIIANNFDPSLGVYQEYYILVYYTNGELNSGMGGYFENEGILVYHVNASLISEEYEGEIYYDVYNTNTDPSDKYGTENNLIELIENENGYIFEIGDTLGAVTDDLGTPLGYTFTVDSLGESAATITVTAK